MQKQYRGHRAASLPVVSFAAGTARDDEMALQLEVRKLTAVYFTGAKDVNSQVARPRSARPGDITALVELTSRRRVHAHNSDMTSLQREIGNWETREKPASLHTTQEPMDNRDQWA